MRRRRQQHHLREAQPPALAGLAASTASTATFVPCAPAPPPTTGSAHTDAPATTSPTSRHRQPTPCGRPTPPPPAPSPPQHATAPHRAHAHTRSARHHQATQARLPTAQPRPRALTVTIDPAVLKGSTQIIKRGCDIRVRPVQQALHQRDVEPAVELPPTSRSTPTSSNPHGRCSATEGSRVASMRAITAWKP